MLSKPLDEAAILAYRPAPPNHARPSLLAARKQSAALPTRFPKFSYSPIKTCFRMSCRRAAVQIFCPARRMDLPPLTA